MNQTSSDHYSVASTQGWDTVSAITYRQMNSAIAKLASYPGEFGRVASDNSVSVRGKFTDWAMATGGAGPLIHMTLGIADALLQVEGEEPRPFSGSIEIELQAAYIPQPDDTGIHELRINTGHPASVIGGDLEGLTKFFASAAKDLIGDWLNDNLGDFDHVFATVNFDAVLAKNGIAWLAPSHVGYAVAEPMNGATPDNSVFGVMCLIDGAQPNPMLSPQISINAIPVGQDAGFLISRRKMLEHISLPGLAILFDGVTPETISDFMEVTADGTRIQNNAKLTMRQYQLKDLTVTPEIEKNNFQMDLEATEMKLSVYDMSFDVPLLGLIKDAMTCVITYNARYSLGLDEKRHALTLNILHESNASAIKSSQGFRTTKIVLAAAAAVVSVVAAGISAAGKIAATGAEIADGVAEVTEIAGMATETTELVTGAELQLGFFATAKALITGAVQGIETLGINFAWATRLSWAAAGALGVSAAVPMIQQAAADEDLSKIPPLKDLIDKGLALTVQFPGQVSGLDLNTARLNGSLQMGLGRRE